MNLLYKRIVEQKHPVTTYLPISLLKRIDEWGVPEGIASRSQAICKLLEAGLNAVKEKNTESK